MDPAEYARMYDLEDTYWWFQGRKHIVVRILNLLPAFRDGKARVLDMGCGTGLMLECLNRSSWSVGVDFSPLALEFSRKRGAKNLVRADVVSLPIQSESFDLALALDLAEHVERDDALLAEAYRVLKRGGDLVMTVPAHPFLWSDHDEALYHCRRYTYAAFRERVLAAGFVIDRLSYCISFTFPLIVGFRLLQRWLQKSEHPKTHLIVLPGWANKILIGAVALEAFLLKWFNLPIGVTLLVAAQKKKRD
ncbi:MAG TPA: class I SAM-dependent methyltransferase [Sumerlaeia bacterium]|nr:class I SAM-dependent methyltransferase [Sumerlaeia bacterium]